MERFRRFKSRRGRQDDWNSVGLPAFFRPRGTLKSACDLPTTEVVGSVSAFHPKSKSLRTMGSKGAIRTRLSGKSVIHTGIRGRRGITVSGREMGCGGRKWTFFRRNGVFACNRCPPTWRGGVFACKEGPPTWRGGVFACKEGPPAWRVGVFAGKEGPPTGTGQGGVRAGAWRVGWIKGPSRCHDPWREKDSSWIVKVSPWREMNRPWR